MKWIKCSDRLPSKRIDGTAIDVLTYNKWGYMNVALNGNDKDEWYDADDVTHWMPLPEKPND